MEEAPLPEMICLSEFGGDWPGFLSELFKTFKTDFIDRKPNFRNLEMRLKSYPEQQGFPATFYHMTHEGPDEDTRTPCQYRSERLPWAHPVIENCDAWKLKIWPQQRKNKKRLCILLELDGEADYVVILDIRKKYILPWTAFALIHDHEKEKKLNEYRAFLKANP